MQEFKLTEIDGLFPFISPWANNNEELKKVITQFDDYGPELINLISREDRLSLREWLEKQWNIRKESITRKERKNFEKDIRSSEKFSQRVWELYVSASLKHHGLNLFVTKNKGPDFLLRHGERNVWIEAVAPTQGDNMNKVETTKDNLADVPEGVMVSRGGLIYDFIKPKIFRVTSGFISKASYLKQCGADNNVQPSDCCVIAINGGSFGGDMLEEQIILGALYGRGNNVFAKKKGQGNFQGGFYELVDGFPKKNSAFVDVSLFLNDEYKHISAVIYCGNRIYESYRECGENPGNDFVFVYNPMAGNQLDPSLFNFGTHYFWERGSIRSINKTSC